MEDSAERGTPAPHDEPRAELLGALARRIEADRAALEKAGVVVQRVSLGDGHVEVSVAGARGQAVAVLERRYGRGALRVAPVTPARGSGGRRVQPRRG